MNINTNFKRTILGSFALILFGIIAIIALRFLPTIPFLSKQTGPTLDSIVFGDGTGEVGSKDGGGGKSGLGDGIGEVGGKDGKSGTGKNGPALAGPITLDYTKVLEIGSPSPRYWRMSSYDTFNGYSWENSFEKFTPVQCDESLNSDSALADKPLNISVRILSGGSIQSMLVGPLVPARICLPKNSTQAIFDQASFSLRTQEPLSVNTIYEAGSSVNVPSAEALKAVSTNFPSAIQSRNLQLPDKLPKRVKELALKITDGVDNQYDKVKKIETYLGSSGEYQYSLSPPATPSGRDGVDYFLFDIRKGYCVHFSSAMVVLSRSIGIPAREVTGFAPGPWNELTKSVILDNSQAHAWVEAYFPGYGWIEFEPTAGGPAQAELTSSGRCVGGDKSLPGKPIDPIKEGVIPTPPLPPEKLSTETKILTYPSSFYRKDKGVVTGTVKIVNGSPLSKAQVALYLAEDKKSQGVKIGNGSTDSSGKFTATVSVEPNFKLGHFQLIARYAGDTTHLPSDSDPEIVIRAHTNIELSVATSTDNVKISGSLKDDEKNPIVNYEIAIAVDNLVVANIRTNKTGLFIYSFPSHPGIYSITARFIGTDVYDQAEKNIRLSIPFPQVSSPKKGERDSPKSTETTTATSVQTNASLSSPLAVKKSLPWWVFVSAIFFGIVIAGGCYWYYRKHSKIFKKTTVIVKNNPKIFLDIQFPQIEADLPLLWGTIDPPLEVVKIVRPDRFVIPLTINGKEQEIPTEKGEYTFKLRYVDQSITKTVSIINYSEEVEKDFRILSQKYILEEVKLTAREIIEQARPKESNQKRLDILLSLFEKYVYGKKEIARGEYINYYRS